MPAIATDIERKMVLLSGPRQCGKTTFARELLNQIEGTYFSWDIARDRRRLQGFDLPGDSKLWVFDELHKFRSWRGWLKGVFDEHHTDHEILVTGSARLDWYRRGGDSLQGRYFGHRLHPFTLSELSEQKFAHTASERWLADVEQASSKKASHFRNALSALAILGGFPEPLLSGSENAARRWRLAYGELLTREEIRELEMVRDLDRMELLFERLSDGVGSVLSINSLREDLEVAFETVRNWIAIFERTYGVFRLPPYGPPRIKAVKKEQKLYFWDWARVEKEAARFENLMAMHLLRLCHYVEDVWGERCELRYFRDVVGREVDFIILKDRKPWFAVECKLEERPIDGSLAYLLERSSIAVAFQISAEGSYHYTATRIGQSSVHRMDATTFLARLP